MADRRLGRIRGVLVVAVLTVLSLASFGVAYASLSGVDLAPGTPGGPIHVAHHHAHVTGLPGRHAVTHPPG